MHPIFTPPHAFQPPLFHPSGTVILTKKWVVKLAKLSGRQIIRDWWQDAGVNRWLGIGGESEVDRWLGIGVDKHLSNLLYTSFSPRTTFSRAVPHLFSSFSFSPPLSSSLQPFGWVVFLLLGVFFWWFCGFRVCYGGCELVVFWGR